MTVGMITRERKNQKYDFNKNRLSDQMYKNTNSQSKRNKIIRNQMKANNITRYLNKKGEKNKKKKCKKNIKNKP